MGDLPAGLSYSTLPGHEGDVVNNTADYILWNGSNLPPGYGTPAWWNGGLSSDATPEQYQAYQDDPNNPGSEAWAWNQTHGRDAATLAAMRTWSKTADGYHDPVTGATWAPNVYAATIETLELSSQPYSHELASSFQDAAAAIWKKYGFTNWSSVMEGDADATAAWIKESTDAAAAQAAGPSDVPARYLQNGLETYADGTPVDGGYNALADLIRQNEASGGTPGVVTQAMTNLIAQNPALVTALPKATLETYRATLTSVLGDLAVPPATSGATTDLMATGSGGISSGDSSSGSAPSADSHQTILFIIGALAVGVLVWMNRRHG